MPLLAVWLLTCLIWSTVWLFIKIGVSDLPPVSFAASRLIIALLVIVPVTLARRIPLPSSRRDWRLIAGTGVLLLGANYAVIYWGMQFVSSGLTAVLQALTPAFGMVFGHMMLPDERITPVKLLALALGVAGVAVIFADQLSFSGMQSVWGSGAVLSGAMFVAFAYVVMKKRGRHLHPNVITMGQMLAGFVPLMLLAIALEGNPLGLRWTPKTLAAVLYLALFGSVLAAWLNYWLLQRMDATKVLSMGLAEPPLAMILGAFALGETFSGRALAGTICILVSVALVLEVVPSARVRSSLRLLRLRSADDAD